MPPLTIGARDTMSLPPVRPGRLRKLTGGASSVFVENSSNRANLGAAATLDNLTGAVAIFNPQATAVTINYSDRDLESSGATVVSPTAPGATYSQAEATSMKSAVDALTSAARAAGHIA